MKAALLVVLLFTSLSLLGRELAQYEGLYEYQQNTQLIMVGGPNDEILYASISGAHYPLKPTTKADVFVNVADVEVEFVRDNAQNIIGYRELRSDDKTSNPIFKLLDSTQTLPQSIWHARTSIESYPYEYKSPTNLNDDIRVAEANAPKAQAVLEAMTNAIYDHQYKDVHSVLLYHNDALIYEEYFYDAEGLQLHQMRSASKSVIALLVGIAIDQGMLKSVDQKVMSLFPGHEIKTKNTAKSNITLHHLLSMQSGLECNDRDSSSAGNESTVYATEDWIDYILSLDMQNEPGSQAFYCSANVLLLGRVLEKVSGLRLSDFAKKYLFEPLGVKDFKWRFVLDNSSINDFGQVWLRSRDMLKLGILIKQKGLWKGNRLLSEQWVASMTQEQSRISDVPYGYFYWLRSIFHDEIHTDIPQMSGNGGQKVIQLKPHNAVLVLTGGNYNRSSPTNELTAYFILPALRALNNQKETQ